MSTPKTIHIHGRRWFERGNGNTYHSVAIYIDGTFRVKVGPVYGCGDHYAQTAVEYLDTAGHLPGRITRNGTPGECLWRYCERNGIAFEDEVDDVRCKKEL